MDFPDLDMVSLKAKIRIAPKTFVDLTFFFRHLALLHLPELIYGISDVAAEKLIPAVYIDSGEVYETV